MHELRPRTLIYSMLLHESARFRFSLTLFLPSKEGRRYMGGPTGRVYREMEYPEVRKFRIEP